MTGIKKPISNTQRKALRTWYHGQELRPTQKMCITWFEENFNHRPSQSTISDSLSNRYRHLDNDNNEDIDATSFRNRSSNWQELESVLYEWQRSVEAQGAITTGHDLSEKARQLWRTLPQYRDLPEPQFSHGWLARFKKRFNIHKANTDTTTTTTSDPALQVGVGLGNSQVQLGVDDDFLTAPQHQQQMVADHTNPPGEDVDDGNGNGRTQDEPAMVPKLSEALASIRLLIAYTQAQDDSDPMTLVALGAYKRELERKQDLAYRQNTLDRWIR